MRAAVLEELLGSFKRMKECGISDEVTSVIIKQLMEITKKCVENEKMNQSGVLQIVGLLCFLLKRRNFILSVVDCCCLILNEADANISVLIFTSIINNLPIPCDGLMKLILCLIKMYKTLHVTPDVGDKFANYLFKNINKFETKIDEQLTELVESSLSHSSINESLVWLCKNERITLMAFKRMVVSNAFQNELIPYLFKYIRFPEILISENANQILVLFDCIFSSSWRNLPVEFECYWMYLINALESLILCTEEQFNGIYNQIIVEKLLNNIETICKESKTAQILYEAYDCNLYVCDLLKMFVKIVHLVISCNRLKKHHIHCLNIFHTLLKGIQIESQNEAFSSDSTEKLQLKQNLVVIQQQPTVEKCIEQYKLFKKIDKETCYDIADMLISIPFLDKRMVIDYLLFESPVRTEVFILITRNIISKNNNIELDLVLLLQIVQIPRNLNAMKLVELFCEEEKKNKKLQQSPIIICDAIVNLYWAVWCDGINLTSNFVLKNYSTLNKNNVENIIYLINTHPPLLSSKTPPFDGNCLNFIKSKYQYISKEPLKPTNTLSNNVIVSMNSFIKSSYPCIDCNSIKTYTDVVISFIAITKEQRLDLVNGLITYFCSILTHQIENGSQFDPFIQHFILLCFKSVNLSYNHLNESWGDIILCLSTLISHNCIDFFLEKLEKNKPIVSFFYSVILKRHSNLNGTDNLTVMQKVDEQNDCPITKFFTLTLLRFNDDQLLNVIHIIFNTISKTTDQNLQYSQTLLLLYLLIQNDYRVNKYWNTLLIEPFKIKYQTIDLSKLFIDFIMTFFQHILKEPSLADKKELYVSFLLFIKVLPQPVFEEYFEKTKEVVLKICSIKTLRHCIEALHDLILFRFKDQFIQLHEVILSSCCIQVFFFLFDSFTSTLKKLPTVTKYPVLLLNYVFKHPSYFNQDLRGTVQKILEMYITINCDVINHVQLKEMMIYLRPLIVSVDSNMFYESFREFIIQTQFKEKSIEQQEKLFGFVLNILMSSIPQLDKNHILQLLDIIIPQTNEFLANSKASQIIRNIITEIVDLILKYHPQLEEYLNNTIKPSENKPN